MAERFNPTDSLPEQQPTRHTPAIATGLAQLEHYLLQSYASPETRVLYETQIPIMQSLHDKLREHGDDLKGYISLPTGVGKTVLFTEFVKATGLRTLVVAPTTELINQTATEFNKFTADDEIAIGKVHSHEKNADEPITITTYNSFVRHTKRHDSPYIRPEAYDLIILDEAHQAMGKETSRILREYYAHTVQLGLTATENYSQQKKLASLLPIEIHKMSFAEAIALRLISPYSNWVVETDTDLSSVHVNRMNEFDAEELEQAINTEARNFTAAAIYEKFFAGQKAIMFCGGVRHSIDMALLLQSVGISAEPMYGRLSPDQRLAVRKRFANPSPYSGLQVICNDKLLAEGFNEKQVAVCFNLAPTRSTVRAPQRGGRVLRLSEDDPNKHAYVIDFLDKNYRQPPVLFADPEAAGAALRGRELPSIGSQTIEHAYGSAKILCNPWDVEAIANDFAVERRAPKRLKPPEGWQSASNLALRYRLTTTSLYRTFDDLRQAEPELFAENTAEYPAPIKTGKTTFYSPEFIAMLDSRKAELFPQQPAPPANWLPGTLVADLYELKIKPAIAELRKLAGNDATLGDDFRPTNGKGRSIPYFSPELVQKYAEEKGLRYLGDGVPESWQTSETICAMRPMRAVKEALDHLRAEQPTLVLYHSRVVDDERYYSPYFIEQVEKYIRPPYGWRDLEELGQSFGRSLDAMQSLLDDLYAKMSGLPRSYRRTCIVDDTERPFVSAILVNLLRQEHLEQTQTQAPADMPEDTPVVIPRNTRPHIQLKPDFTPPVPTPELSYRHILKKYRRS